MPGNKYFVSESSRPFNPKHRFFKACCCHVQKFTIAFAIVEIFMVCFLLAAVIPDLNSKLCGTSITSRIYTPAPENRTNTEIIFETNNSSQNDLNNTFYAYTQDRGNDSLWYNSSGYVNTPLYILHFITCDINLGWLSLAIWQIMSANVMLYGIKSKTWALFVPHIIVRLSCAMILMFMCCLMVSGLTMAPTTNVKDTIIFCLPLGLLLVLLIIYVLLIELKATIFTKRSAETGFSFTSTRTVTGPSQSVSDHQQRPQIITISMRTLQPPNNPTIPGSGNSTMRMTELPPLRHNFGIGAIGR